MYLMEVILDFNTLRGIKPQIVTPKRYGDHPSISYEIPPSPFPGVFKATLGGLRSQSRPKRGQHGDHFD